MTEPFHASLVYVWHYAKCDGMSEKKYHSHAVVSYDRPWIHRMYTLIKDKYAFKPLPSGDLEQIRLEEQAANLIQKRKSLEVTYGR